MNKLSIISRYFINAVLAAVLLSSCGRTKDAQGNPAETVTSGSATYHSVSAVDYWANGMHYKVFNSAKGDVFAVNLSLDSLQYERLKNSR